MSLAIVHTRAALGVNAPPITIEVHISNGLPGLTMVGLPETTVKRCVTGYVVRLLIADMNFRLKNNHLCKRVNENNKLD